MMLKVLLLVSAGAAVVYGECGPCASIPKHYEELGCKAIKENDSDCCPVRFECPNFTGLDKSKCNFQGKGYAAGESITSDKQKLPTCTKKCTCKQDGGNSGFDCEFESCPEAAEEPKPECRNQYTLNSCCAVKTICDKAEVEKLHTCWFEGRDFHGGNLIYPASEPCYKCLCDEKFDNTTAISKNANCQRVDCGIEVHALSNFQQGCLPVYFDDNYCCPVEYRCPKDSDAPLPGKGKSAAESGPQLTCKYGSLELGLGQTVKQEDKCLDCTCKNPPLAECVRTITTEECH